MRLAPEDPGLNPVISKPFNCRFKLRAGGPLCSKYNSLYVFFYMGQPQPLLRYQDSNPQPFELSPIFALTFRTLKCSFSD